ncbi:hypothetical protein [Streptomyces yokosukanensis]|uniref:hypothetical protein n=1 Tax=Streptomyces yokosukanensis TaxID=67386 RepID=UPI000AC35B89|nr:hypothetical protein [Streptomyces yokosukanensis]
MRRPGAGDEQRRRRTSGVAERVETRLGGAQARHTPSSPDTMSSASELVREPGAHEHIVSAAPAPLPVAEAAAGAGA